MVRGKLAQLFENDPRIDEVLEVEDKPGRWRFLEYFKIADRIARQKYDLGLILPESFSSALIFYLAGIPEKIGFDGDLRSFMLTRTIPQPDAQIHRSKKYLHLIKSLGVSLSDDYSVELHSSETQKKQAGEFVTDSDSYTVVAPFSRAPSRRWGKEKYAELAKKIYNDLNLRIVFSGAPDENSVVEEVAEMAQVPYINLAGKSDLMTSFEIMKSARVYVGNDSGGAHLAAASGVFTISISGADDPRVTRPLVQKGTVIRKPLFCSPCVKNICPRRDIPNECMRIISVDEFFEAVREAVNE
jgi:heptosyltransferase-2